MAVRQLDQSVVRRRRHAAPTQVLPALLRAEVAERHHPQQISPRRVGPPPGGRGRATRDHGQRRRRQARQQAGTQPIVQWSQVLVRIDEEHDPAAAASRSARHPPAHRASRQGRPERHPPSTRQIVPVEADDLDSGPLGPCRQDIDQGGLSHAARPIQVQHRERPVGRIQGGLEDFDLGRTPHEAVESPRPQHVTQHSRLPFGSGYDHRRYTAHSRVGRPRQ